MTNEKAVAEKLLQINAIKLSPQQPFTWASGWRSPIYCDNRKVLSYPYIRDFIKSEMCSVIFERFPDAEVLAGVATAGIAWGAISPRCGRRGRSGGGRHRFQSHRADAGGLGLPARA